MLRADLLTTKEKEKLKMFIEEYKRNLFERGPFVKKIVEVDFENPIFKGLSFFSN